MAPLVLVDDGSEAPDWVPVLVGVSSLVSSVVSEADVSLAPEMVIVAFEDPVMAVVLLRPVIVVMVELWGLVCVPVV